MEFKPEQFSWTNTVGKPRTLGQLFTEWKKCESVNYEPREIALEDLIQSAAKSDTAGEGTSFIQFKTAN